MSENAEQVSNDTREVIEAAVDAAVERRIGRIANNAKWFGMGLGFFLIALIALGLTNRSAVILEFLGGLIGFDDYIATHFDRTIAVSYHNQFWLGTGDDEDRRIKLVFYAAPGQTADLRVDVTHRGTGERLRVRAWLNDETDDLLYNSNENGPDHSQIERLSSQTSQGSRPHPNVHEIHFELLEDVTVTEIDGQRTVAPIEDRVFIAALVNVYGQGKSE